MGLTSFLFCLFPTTLTEMIFKRILVLTVCVRTRAHMCTSAWGGHFPEFHLVFLLT